jgi:acyl transferase domain-containing protein
MTPLATTPRQRHEPVAERPVGGDDIAIVGMSGRFAAAADLAAFHEAVLTGDSLLGPVPEGRFGWILPPRGAMAQARGGFIAGVDHFDAALFGIGNREAARMDPQSRLLLEACRATLEDAGHAPRSLAGRCVGVFIANTFQEWLHRLRQPGRVERIRLTDMTICMLASRIARAFDLRGSAEVVNAACSGGLLAVHRACMALRAGECEAALAGGVSLILAGDGYLGEARAGMLSADCRSLAFDSAGNGFVRGEGVGVLLLKTLARARADRDVVHAIIRGSAAGHGGAAGGYDADLAVSQADAVARALRSAGVDPASIGYLELQAAGRPTDEAAELAVIAAGFRQAAADGVSVPQPLIGALKPLTGHMEAASGLGQVVKVAAVLRGGIVPPIGGLSQPAEAVRAVWPGLQPCASRSGSGPGRLCLNAAGTAKSAAARLPTFRHDTGPSGGCGGPARLCARRARGSASRGCSIHPAGGPGCDAGAAGHLGRGYRWPD